MVTVGVTAEWTSSHTFEFEDEAAAQRFRERVEAGGDDALAAIVEAGDVDSQIAELSDFSVDG